MNGAVRPFMSCNTTVTWNYYNINYYHFHVLEFCKLKCVPRKRSHYAKDDTSNIIKFVSFLRKTEFKKKICFMVQMLLLEIRYVV